MPHLLSALRHVAVHRRHQLLQLVGARAGHDLLAQLLAGRVQRQRQADALRGGSRGGGSQLRSIQRADACSRTSTGGPGRRQAGSPCLCAAPLAALDAKHAARILASSLATSSRASPPHRQLISQAQDPGHDAHCGDGDVALAEAEEPAVSHHDDRLLDLQARGRWEERGVTAARTRWRAGGLLLGA